MFVIRYTKGYVIDIYSSKGTTRRMLHSHAGMVNRRLQLSGKNDTHSTILYTFFITSFCSRCVL
jgi:hypothetical protein